MAPRLAKFVPLAMEHPNVWEQSIHHFDAHAVCDEHVNRSAFRPILFKSAALGTMVCRATPNVSGLIAFENDLNP